MKKTSLSIIAASLLLVAGQASALNNIGGVVWDPNSLFDFTTTDQMWETTATNLGDVVSGYGRITGLNANLQASFCPTCELTYEFGGYTLINNTAGAFTFAGGWINVYVDPGMNFNALMPATAGEGTLWLGLVAHDSYDVTSGRNGTLHSDPTPITMGVQGNGGGYLDVAAGLAGGVAAGAFNTGIFTVQIDAAGNTDTADFLFTSSFQLLPHGPIVGSDGREYSLFGSNDLQGDSIEVPEPGTMALLGLGVLGLGAVRRRSKKA